ncbi:5-methylthioadenosine/S-adenosylhomocysteine deaminase n1 [Apiospora kogelbergensis]|uniref:5-methylthioadenosine/S-adenosylhomocysteine deaminase n1 n=1 Tax=Apiospora kogelbergensis TaxID=1337665 RepID=A0AAW0QQ11_9PEZI
MSDSPGSILLRDVTVITVDARRRVILNGFILIQDDRITHVSSKSPDQIPEGVRVLSLPGRIVIPGLINSHAHLAQSLLRGLAEDLPLHSWLCDRIWPLEAAYGGEGDAADGYIAARLTIAEMLLSGTTCFLEAMLTHGSGFANVARAVSEMGIRACLGKLVKFVETNPALEIADARDKDVDHMSIPSLLSAHSEFHGTCNDRIHVWAACGTPRGAPLSSFAAVGKACKQRDIGITMHCAEAPRDLPILREVYGQTPMQFCRAAELAGPKTVLAHMCHLDMDIDLPILRESQTTVAHNPTSNLKLASGIAKASRMLKDGVNVALGTDGAPCNNSYDMLREMHLASILHKGSLREASSIGAHDALEMATIRGAKALGLEAEVGSLEPGKKADLAVLDVRGSWAAPWTPDLFSQGGADPVSLVVGSCTGRDVTHVMVDGRMLVEDGRLLVADERTIIQSARQAVAGIQERSGVKASRKEGWEYE